MAIINYGDTGAWILLTTTYGGNTHNLYIICEDWDYGNDDISATGIDYPSRGHFGFTLNTEKVTIKIKKAYVITEAGWNELKKGIVALQDSTEDVTLRIQISSTPTYELFDGTTGHDVMPVLIKKDNARKKLFRGDATVYGIGQILLIQVGALS